MAIITIHNLNIKATLGIHEWEQQKPRNIIINAYIEYDSHKAEQSDNIHDAIDYNTITENISKISTKKPYKLIEHLAYTIKEHIQAHYPINNIEIEIIKPGAVPHTQAISIKI